VAAAYLEISEAWLRTPGSTAPPRDEVDAFAEGATRLPAVNRSSGAESNPAQLRLCLDDPLSQETTLARCPARPALIAVFIHDRSALTTETVGDLAPLEQALAVRSDDHWVHV
jgi:hypothetical protein